MNLHVGKYIILLGLPQRDGLNNGNFIVFQLWKLEVQNQVSAGLVPSEGCEGRMRSRPMSFGL